MSALFNFQSLLTVVLLLICTCAYVRTLFPSILDRNKVGFLGTFWKCARIGERKSPFTHLCKMLLRGRFTSSNLQIKNLHTIPLGNTEHLKDVIRLPIIHHHGYVCNLPPEHRFPMKKFHKVYEILISSGIVTKPSQILVPYKLNKNLALLVHTEDYTENFFNGTTTTEEQRVTGFTWTPDLLSRVQYECGGTVLSATVALDRGLACSTAGGTHHAFPDHGAGFCLLNDIAIAAQFLLMSKKAQKVLIVDLDVHQGDGTAFIFKNTDKVFTFSMHCGKNFPFRKQVSDLDVDLNVGTEDKEYMIHLVEHLPSILDSYRPDIVLYDAGVDPHVHDDLGKLNLSDEGLFRRDLFVLTNVLQRGIPCATVIGGGYCHDIDTLAKRHTIIHHAANKVWNQIGL